MTFIDRLKPLVSRARPRFGLSNEVSSVADRRWELSPATETDAPPAIFREADLEKITGVGPDDTLTSQLQRVRGGSGRHKATMAYEIRDAVMVDGNLYSYKASLPIVGRKSLLRDKVAGRHYTRAALASSAYGVRFFGHWMLDDLPRLLAAREISTPVSVAPKPTATQTQYTELLGLASDQVLNASFDSIIVIDDVGQNDYKRERYARLRALAVGQPLDRRGPGVMLMRGTTGTRRILVNEGEVADMARSRGMQVIEPAARPAHEVVEACRDASIILGVEGSQLSNGLLFMSRLGAVAVIQPPQRFVMVLKDTCDCIGLRYAFVVGDPVNATDFQVDVGELERILDRLKA